MSRTGSNCIRLVLACVLAMLVWPGAARAGEVPDILVPVTDLAGVLSDSAEAQITRRLEEHRAATNVQMAVLTVDTTRGVPIEDYALTVATRWGGGSARVDDGALFVLAVDDRQMRLELGYGLEAQIPDAQARRLLDAAIPNLRADDYANATHVVVEGVIGMTGGTSRASEQMVAPATDPPETWAPKVWIEPAARDPSPSFGPSVAFTGFLCLAYALVIGFLAVFFRQLADRERASEDAKDPPPDTVEARMPPMGARVVVLLVIVVVAGSLPFALGFGVAYYFAGLLGATFGYFIVPVLGDSTAFSGSNTSSAGRSFWSSSSRSSSFGSSIGSSSRSSSRSSWGGGGGKFGGGGASSRW